MSLSLASSEQEPVASLLICAGAQLLKDLSVFLSPSLLSSRGIPEHIRSVQMSQGTTHQDQWQII